MERRTLEIIAVCKGNTRYDSEIGLVDAVKNYMSDTCRCEKAWYTDGQMFEILKTAFYDFLDVCDRPSFFLRQLDEFERFVPSITTRVCSVFQTVDVCDGDVYVNGFNSDYEKIAEKLQS